jgi:hypothetical protein
MCVYVRRTIHKITYVFIVGHNKQPCEIRGGGKCPSQMAGLRDPCRPSLSCRQPKQSLARGTPFHV